MRKLFPFDRADAQRRAEAARRATAKAAIDAQLAEQRRRDGEKAAAELKNFDVWFNGAVALEADAKREQRMAAARLRPIIARSPPQPERVIALVLFEDPIEEAIFGVRTTAREIEKLSHWFDRRLRGVVRLAPRLNDRQAAATVVKSHSGNSRYDVRAAMCWLIWNVADYREALSNLSVTGLGFIVEKTRVCFLTRGTESYAGDYACRGLYEQPPE